MVKIDLVKEFGKIPRLMIGGLERGMSKALEILLVELKRLTPEDTKEMLNSYKVEPIIIQGDKVIGRISNGADHAVIVEYGVPGKVFNYHKPKGSVFNTGVGNRTFATAVDNKRQEILDIIAKEIGF